MILRSLFLICCLSCVTVTYAASDKSGGVSHTEHPPHDHPDHDHLKKLDEWIRNSRKKKETP